jgi:hypothetical protein
LANIFQNLFKKKPKPARKFTTISDQVLHSEGKTGIPMTLISAYTLTLDGRPEGRNYIIYPN